MESQTTCAICLDGFEQLQKVQLPCKHEFHANCIADVFRGGDPRCPVCRDVPDHISQRFQTARERQQNSETVVRTIEETLREFLVELERNVYEGAHASNLRQRRYSAAVVPPRIVINAASTPEEQMRLSVGIDENGATRVLGFSLHDNCLARKDLAHRDEALGNLRKTATRLRSACENRGILMRAIENAIYAHSPNLHNLLASMRAEHELHRTRAETAQRAFVEAANTRLGIIEQFSLF